MKNRPVVTQTGNFPKPVLGNAEVRNKPNIGTGPKKPKWSFSFEYFEQIRYFGLGNTDTKWFVALLDRLKDLSKQNVDLLLSNYTQRDSYRFHPIKWDAENIPMQRHDFDWVDKAILDNEEEYPFFQFQISTALGRVVGYFDENHEHFYILLLDHKHNIQPSKRNNYKVDDTTEMYCDFTSFLMDVDKLKGMTCPVADCKCKAGLNEIPSKAGKGKFVYFNIDEGYYPELMKKLENKSLKDIIELGLCLD